MVDLTEQNIKPPLSWSLNKGIISGILTKTPFKRITFQLREHISHEC